MVGSGSNSKNTTQRKTNRVWKMMWETLKCANIVEEYEDQKAIEIKTFYTPLDSPNQLTYENELCGQ
jgi:hypothetical protein